MRKNQKIIAIIPARGGSKGIPRKNIKLLKGKPLIAYAIGAALKAKLIDRVIVSTDDEEIARIAKERGADVPFLRPAELALDGTATLPVLQHAVNYLDEKENYKADIIVLVQPTSPLVLAEDIDQAIEKLMKTGANSCVSLCKISERPEFMYSFEETNIKRFLETETDKAKRRQELPEIFRLNGAVYVTRRKTLMEQNKIIDHSNATAIIMPHERSIDIDEPIDFKIAELLLQETNDKKD